MKRSKFGIYNITIKVVGIKTTQQAGFNRQDAEKRALDKVKNDIEKAEILDKYKVKIKEDE